MIQACGGDVGLIDYTPRHAMHTRSAVGQPNIVAPTLWSPGERRPRMVIRERESAMLTRC